MQAYKLKKIFETAIYPVENEIRAIRQENDKSWEKLLEQVGSVAFSGIGTTIAFQEDFMPSLLRKIFPDINGILLVGINIFAALLIFTIITTFFWFLIYWHYANNDKKRSEKERIDLAEYFHKVILNNILTGISFTKRAWNKKKEYDNKSKLLAKLDQDQENYLELKESYLDSQKYYEKEIKLYISEAIYYFKIANKQFENERIIERGMREEFIKFIDIVGLSTLKNVFDMYNQSFANLEILNNDNDVNKNDIYDIKEFLTKKELSLKKAEKGYLQQKEKKS